MFAAFKELLASGRSLLPFTGPSAASSLLLATPSIADPTPVPPAVAVAVSVASVATSARSADSSSQSCERMRYPSLALDFGPFP